MGETPEWSIVIGSVHSWLCSLPQGLKFRVAVAWILRGGPWRTCIIHNAHYPRHFSPWKRNQMGLFSWFVNLQLLYLLVASMLYFFCFIFHSSEFTPKLTAWYFGSGSKIIDFWHIFSPSVSVWMALLQNLKNILICKYWLLKWQHNRE